MRFVAEFEDSRCCI